MIFNQPSVVNGTGTRLASSSVQPSLLALKYHMLRASNCCPLPAAISAICRASDVSLFWIVVCRWLIAATRSFFSLSSLSAACVAVLLTSAIRSVVSFLTALSQPLLLCATDCLRLFSTRLICVFNVASPVEIVLLTALICLSISVLMLSTVWLMVLLISTTLEWSSLLFS